MSMGPSEMQPTVLKKLAKVFTKPLFMIFETSWKSGEVQSDMEKKAMSKPILRRVEMAT